MKRLWVLVVALSLAGCVTGPGYKTRMTGYVGGAPDLLVQQLGVPDKQITVNGVQYFAYKRYDEAADTGFLLTGFGPWAGPGPFYGIDTAPGEQEVLACETTFSVRDNRVAGVTFRGDDCD